jgi:hypothetical protein
LHEFLQLIDFLLNSHTVAKKADIEFLIKGLVEKLGDNKIMIRQLANGGLKAISKGQQPLSLINTLIPYLASNKWHIREEVLELIILCFLEAKNSLEYELLISEIDYASLIQRIIKLIHDDKAKVVQIAFEAVATLAHIGDKDEVMKLLRELNDAETLRKLMERIEAECIPKINSEGLLEFPYISNELTTQNSFYINSMTGQKSGNPMDSCHNYSNSRFTSAGPYKQMPPNNVFDSHSSALKRPQTDNMGVFLIIFNL